MQVIASALIECVVLHREHHVQVASGPAASAAFALPGVADSRTIFHSGGDLHFKRTVLHRAALAFALQTRVGNDLPGAAALRARPRHAEKSLLESNLASTTAARTGHRLLPSGGPIATAFRAGLMPPYFDFGRLAEHGFFKLQGEIDAQIVAA